ncbi:MAG TPA: DUF4423 domain-containing protein [Polyangiaceae bacterium]|nr:DUF4423 domain-containing protein [Polyangiaceae bacterium]
MGANRTWMCNSFDMSHWDYEEVAAELLRALRGRRSQNAFSRRLGYKSNVVHCWEAGRAFPTASRTLHAAARVGVDVPAALVTLYRKPPGWFERLDATTPEGIAQFLNDLRGHLSLAQIAAFTGRNRFAIARWLKCQTEPRLPDFLRLIEATSLRMLDFVAALVDPSTLPLVRDRWNELERSRRATYEHPWSQAVLRLLETQAYQRLRSVRLGWIAARLGISLEQERQAVEALLHTQQIEITGGKYQVRSESRVIDTRRDPEAAWALRTFWADVALTRLKGRGEGLFSHNVFGVSEHDLGRLRELQKAYFNEVRAIIAQSEPVERVALLNVQLLPLA